MVSVSYLVFFLMVFKRCSLLASESFAPTPIHGQQRTYVSVCCQNRTVESVLCQPCKLCCFCVYRVCLHFGFFLNAAVWKLFAVLSRTLLEVEIVKCFQKAVHSHCIQNWEVFV